jgi:DNA-binding NarL/FixJ family response regulator
MAHPLDGFHIQELNPAPGLRKSMIHKVILADNQSVFRTGAARLFAVEDDFRIIGQCDDVPRLMKATAATPNAAIVFAASLQPDIPALVRFAQEAGSTTTAVLENDESPQAYVAAGVRGIVHRDILTTDLLRCIRQVGRGESFVQRRSAGGPAGFESDMVAERVRDRLTPKELKILGLILQGYKNKEIAEELKNSEQVIKNYLRSIFDKTGVSDRLELALFTMHHKILAHAASRANDGKSADVGALMVN